MEKMDLNMTELLARSSFQSATPVLRQWTSKVALEMWIPMESFSVLACPVLVVEGRSALAIVAFQCFRVLWVV